MPRSENHSGIPYKHYKAQAEVIIPYSFTISILSTHINDYLAFFRFFSLNISEGHRKVNDFCFYFIKGFHPSFAFM